MTSPYARPDRTPLDELERLLAAVEEELAGVRRGAGKSDSEAGYAKGRGAAGPELQQSRQRIALLEGENHLLRQRIAAAREQVERLRTRLRFIEDRGTGDAA
ncbi:MAG TPA: hypothetical protein VGQ73_05865 [Gemmatimonadales bacterium]|nr:hypothetical protein [Gemmatimonadales bacterium]